MMSRGGGPSRKIQRSNNHKPLIGVMKPFDAARQVAFDSPRLLDTSKTKGGRVKEEVQRRGRKGRMERRRGNETN